MTVDTSVLYSGLWFQDDQILCEKMSHRQHLVSRLSQQVFLLPWDVMIFFSMWEKEILQLSDEGRQNIISPRIRTAYNKTEHCLLCNKASEIQTYLWPVIVCLILYFVFALSCCYYFGLRSYPYTEDGSKCIDCFSPVLKLRYLWNHSRDLDCFKYYYMSCPWEDVNKTVVYLQNWDFYTYTNLLS